MALKNLIDAAKEPYKMVKDMVSKILPVIKRNVERIKENLIEMKQNIVNVGKHSHLVLKFLFLLSIEYPQLEVLKKHFHGWKISLMFVIKKKVLHS